MEHLGVKRYALPIGAVLIIFCVFSVLLYPLLNAEPKDVPMAVLNLDTGATTPAGPMNLGEELVKQATQVADSPIKWTVMEDRAALDKALEDNEFYGAIVVPVNFTRDQLAAQTEGGLAPKIEIIINQGKNPMLATTMETSLTSMMSRAGMATDVKVIHSADVGTGIAAMLSSNAIVLPTFMMSAVCAILIGLALRPKPESGRAARLGSYMGQLVYAAAISLLVGAGTVTILTFIGGVTTPYITLGGFLWIASFCLMTMIMGFMNIARPLGIFIALTCFALGMGVGMLAKEMLPQLWRTWVYPWVPQHFISQGTSSIIFMKGGIWNSGTLPLIITGLVGLVLTILSGVLGGRKKAKDTQP